MKTTKYELQPGDTIETVAHEAGLSPEGQWNCEANEALREKRGEAVALEPGDILAVPERRLKEETVSVGTMVRFRRKHSPAMLHLRMTIDGEPRSDTHCGILIDGNLVRLTTDGEGRVDCPALVNAKAAQLMVFYGDATPDVTLDLCALEPTIEVAVGESVLLIEAAFERRPRRWKQGPPFVASSGES